MAASELAIENLAVAHDLTPILPFSNLTLRRT